MGVLTNFRAEDFEALKSGDDEKAERKPRVAKKTTAPQKPVSNEPLEGTTQEVLDWVGDDVARARKALSAEKKHDDPRVTLTEPLEKMIEDDKAARKQAAAEKKAAAAEEKKKSE